MTTGATDEETDAWLHGGVGPAAGAATGYRLVAHLRGCRAVGGPAAGRQQGGRTS